MAINIQGKQMDIGDALQTHIREKLDSLAEKYFNRTIGGTVTLTPEGHAFFKAHIILQVGQFTVVGHATAGDAYGAFDDAAEKVGKQMRRYKKRLRDHHERTPESPEAEMRKARDYVLATSDDHEEEQPEAANSNDPVVVAETITDVPTLTVHDAVMCLDLSSEPAMLFHNAKHGRINMVYRRSDGAIGWVDPDEGK